MPRAGVFGGCRGTGFAGPQAPPPVGGGSATRSARDLDRLLAEETGLPVLVAEDPLTCVVRGCGIALERMDRLGSIFTSE